MEISSRTGGSSTKKKRSRPKIVYRPEDVGALDYKKDLGRPGGYPFTRGIHPEMYRTRLWTMRQYAGYASAEESNRRYRYLRSQGATGLSVAFDLPTQLGLDSDHLLAEGEVGKVGVAIDSLEDMERLFEGISLSEVSTSMTINATACILLAMYLVVAKKNGEKWKSLRGTVQNDILKEYIARGTYIYPPKPSLRIITDIFSFCSKEVPRWNTISISGYHIREAGCTAAQEIAFTLANGEIYVQAAVQTGLEIDEFASRLSFFFNAHKTFFEEVAKFRAARRLWARLMRDRLGARRPKSWMLRFHAQTAGSTLTARSPENNVVRVTLQALSAVLGGAQSLHTNSKDEALALPTQQAALLALRTQQVLAYESGGVAQVVDPLGGSWYVEKLTQDLEEKAEAYLEKIRSLGGMLQAIESGYVQREIQEAAYQQQTRLESGDEIVVGINRFESEESPIEVLRIDPEVGRRQSRRLKTLRNSRDAGQVNGALERIRQVARGQANLMPTIIEAVGVYATVGEIADAMKGVFGEHKETIVI